MTLRRRPVSASHQNNHDRCTVETCGAVRHLEVSVVKDNLTLYCQEYFRWEQIMLHAAPHPKANGVLAASFYRLEKPKTQETLYASTSSDHYWKCWVTGYYNRTLYSLMRLPWFWPPRVWKHLSLHKFNESSVNNNVLLCPELLPECTFSSKLYAATYSLFDALKLQRSCIQLMSGMIFLMIKINNGRVTCCYKLII